MSSQAKMSLTELWTLSSSDGEENNAVCNYEAGEHKREDKKVIINSICTRVLNRTQNRT